MDFVSRIRFRGIVLVSVVFFLILAYNSIAKSPPPGLDEVLKKQNFVFDLGFLVFSFFALSLSALSLAKTYEILRKPFPKNEEAEFDKAEIENLRAKTNELHAAVKFRDEENEALKNEIKRLEAALALKIDSENLIKKAKKQASMRKRKK